MRISRATPADLRGLVAKIGEPWIVLGPLLLVQWLALLAFALTVRHNGWLYYQGGDQTFYWTTSWLLSDWTLPPTPIGYGWSYLLSPIALFAGKNVLVGLPAVMLLNALVLLPVALLCVYGIAARIAGRLFGYWAAALWIAVPYAAIPLWDQRYHQKYVELTLPQTLGFSGLADFPSMVWLLLAAFLAVRALDTGDRRDAALAGITVGFAIGIKPSNLIFLAAPVLAFLVGRRWRLLLAFAVAFAPGVVVLTIWKARGLGEVPVLATSGQLPAATLSAALPAASILGPVEKYVNLDWHVLSQNLDALREFFWSVRPLEWVPLAGALGIARRSWPKAALVFAWFAAFLLIKGTDPHARVEDASFFRLLMPSFPAYLLLLAAIPLLAPKLAPAIGRRFPAGTATPRRYEALLAGAGVLLILVPLIVVSSTSLQRDAVAVTYEGQSTYIPVAASFRVLAERTAGGGLRLRWRAPYDGSVAVFYTVFRSPALQRDPDSPKNPPVVEGVNCYSPSVRPGAAACRVLMAHIGSTRAPSWLDRPPPGRWTYRIALSANWLDDSILGDALVLSRPATVTVER